VVLLLYGLESVFYSAHWKNILGKAEIKTMHSLVCILSYFV
jgi:hypothetical protein